MHTWKFRLGDHGLAAKRGHCTACSQAQAVLTIEAHTLDQAIERANNLIKSPMEVHGYYSVATLTFLGPITARMLIKETA